MGLFLNLLVLTLTVFIGRILAENYNLTRSNSSTDTTTPSGRTARVVIDDKNLENDINAEINEVLQTETGVHELDTWEAPYHIRKYFPYYHTGYDEDMRPIWVGEIGKWNFRMVTDAGVEEEKIFEKYMEQTAHRIIKSVKEQNTEDNPVTDCLLILDMEDFSIIQMAHVRTISLILRLLGQFRPLIDRYLHLSLVINTNAPAHALVTATRPVLGRIMEKTEVFGTNRATWLPQVIKNCPRDQLPPWYGGSNKNFKPLKVYG